jgi:hypothetical protein
MGVGIRTRDLRKVYTSPPPIRGGALVGDVVAAATACSALAPQYPHISTPIIVAVLAVFDAVLIVVAMQRFRSKAVS